MRAPALLAAVVLLTSGCSDLAFREDKRLEILAPGDRESVELPLEIKWTIDDFTAIKPDGTSRRDRGYFAVFVDRAPMPPGKDLESLAKDDEACEADPGCPDEAWLTSHNVYLTTKTSLTLESLPDTRSVERPQEKDRHDVTIVLIDGTNKRIGESAFFREFVIAREDRF